MTHVHMPSHILITGGAGFIGRHVAHALAQRGHRLTVLDNFSNATHDDLPSDWTIVEADLRDPEARIKALEGVHHVVHLAALVSVPVSLEQPLETFDVNVAATDALLRDCIRLKLPGKFIYASSAAVYNAETTPPFAESAADGRALLSPYAASKFINEIQAATYARCYGLQTLGLRFFNVYGPGQNPASSYSGVLSRLLHAQRHGNTFSVNGDGSHTRDFIAVSDIAELIAHFIDYPSSLPPVMNLGTGQPTSLSTLINTWREVTDQSLTITHAAPRAGDQLHSCADITLLRKLLPKWQLVSLRTGLHQWLKG